MKTACAAALIFAVFCAPAADIVVDPGIGLSDVLERVASRRAAGYSGLIRIMLAPGDYFMPEGLEIGARHAPKGCGGLAVASDGRARLFGGVSLGGWSKERFNGRDDVWSVRVERGLCDNPPELFVFDGHKMERARWPNADARHPYSGGWANVAGKPVDMNVRCPGANKRSFLMEPADRRGWSDPSEGIICLFPRFNWINEVQKIADYDLGSGRMTSGYPFRYEIRPGNRYCIMGLKEELDAAGEWYFDRGRSKMFFIPPDGKDPNKSLCILPCGSAVVSITNACNVKLEGLEVTAADKGIVAMGCTALSIVGCRIHDIGFFYGSAVSVSKSERCVVADCDIWNIGKHGVCIEGGDPRTLERSGNLVENCYIHHCGQIDRHGIGVWLRGQGGTVRHCLIHDMPRSGVNHSGRLHTVEYNVIRHTNLETEDTGAIYGGGWCGGAGTKIRFNHITDSIGFVERNGKRRFNFFASGIHLDEAIGGVEVVGNFVARSNLAALNLHNARHVIVSNNVFVSNAGKEGWFWQLQVEGWNSATDGYFVAMRQRPISREWHALVGGQSAWTNFPSIAHSPDDPFLPDGNVMCNLVFSHNIFYYPDQPKSQHARLRNFNFSANSFDHNLIFSPTRFLAHIVTGERLDEEKWRALGMDVHSIFGDPLFVDPANGDYRLKDDSPARQLGIVELPFSEMGLRPTRWRPHPFREADGVREHQEWLSLPPSNAYSLRPAYGAGTPQKESM